MDSATAFWKLSTDKGAIGFCKLVVSGEIDNPFSRQTWDRIVECQALGNYEGCTKAQSISRYLLTEVGTWLFKASKVAPPEIDKRASYLADQRLGTISLDEARRLGGPKIRAKTIDARLNGTGDKGRSPGTTAAVGHEGRGGLSGAAQSSSARKSDAEKDRAQRQYLASGSSWPSI
jgi:hypothetical protein